MTEHELILRNQVILLRLLKAEYLSGCVDRADRERAQKFLVEELGIDDQIEATQFFLRHLSK